MRLNETAPSLSGLAAPLAPVGSAASVQSQGVVGMANRQVSWLRPVVPYAVGLRSGWADAGEQPVQQVLLLDVAAATPLDCPATGWDPSPDAVADRLAQLAAMRLLVVQTFDEITGDRVPVGMSTITRLERLLKELRDALRTRESLAELPEPVLQAGIVRWAERQSPRRVG